MGRSQRRMILTQGSNAAGAVHDEGVIAPGLVLQIGNPPVSREYSDAGPKGIEEDLVVPMGPAGGPLEGSSLTGPIPEGANIPGPTPPNPPGPDPLPGEEPVLNSINPNGAAIGSADVVMNVNGNRFTESSTIYFNGGAENTTFVNAGQLRTTVKPSLASIPIAVPVWVQQGSFKTVEKTFTFREPTGLLSAGDERTLPAGPFAINLVEDHPDGVAIHMAEGDIRVGDTVLIEATGNTSVNGNYAVLAINENVIIVDNMVVLDTPIEGKGRVTVNGEA